MEGRSPPGKSAPSKQRKGEITSEATASSPVEPSYDDREPPALEDVSETHSKGSSPRLSSPLSEDLEKGTSPRSSYSKKGHSSLSPSEKDLSPLSHTNRARTPLHFGEQRRSPPTYADEILSPASPTDRQQGDQDQAQSNGIPEQNESTTSHTEAKNSEQTFSRTGILPNAKTPTTPKTDTKSSMRTSIPSLKHSVASAVRRVSFKSPSLSSKSSSVYGAKPWWKTTPRPMKYLEVALRIGGAILALIAFSVMCATTERRQGAGSTFKVSFKDYQAYSYLVALNVISFLYSCWQAAASLNSRIGDVFETPRENMLFTHVCDQVLAFLLFSASTAAATASQLSRHGLHNIWPPACATWSLWHFCAQADAAVAMSFLSSFFVICSSVYSAYNISHSLSE